MAEVRVIEFKSGEVKVIRLPQTTADGDLSPSDKELIALADERDELKRRIDLALQAYEDLEDPAEAIEAMANALGGPQ